MTTSDFFSEDALFDRLTSGVRRNQRPVTFLVGSAVSSPISEGTPGVPNTDGIVELIRREFDSDVLDELNREIEASEHRYQTAFRFLQGRRGQAHVNDIVKKAVWSARAAPIDSSQAIQYVPTSSTDDEVCLAYEDDISSWWLSPSHKALGQLLSKEPNLFGGSILTTNFDPLIEVAIRSFGGAYYRTTLHRDGDLNQTHSDGCHVIHLHGHWFGTDTLHTPRQLSQSRPRLESSLYHLIKGRTVVVVGYGGWDDVFTQALMNVVVDDRASPDVLWTFRSDAPAMNPKLQGFLLPGLDRGNVTLYSGVDCNAFLPRLASGWGCEGLTAKLDENAHRDLTERTTSSRLARTSTETKFVEPIDFTRGEQDHPPKVDFYVGRKSDIEKIIASDSKIVYLTGIGGQGKSALAAEYFSFAINSSRYDHYVWRDCKEESERFERQLISIVTALSHDRVHAHELATQPIDTISDLFIELIGSKRILIIFDNIDHYIDLQARRPTGNIIRFIDRLIGSNTNTRIIFTCRPEILHNHIRVLSHRMGGISLQEAAELFHLRGASTDSASLFRAHELTQGHALWLDLLAAQLARRGPEIELNDLLDELHGDTPQLPIATLRSIWATLREPEQLVLRTLAETVRPTTILQLSNYLSEKIRYNKLDKARRSLRNANLLVVKPQGDGQDVMELHPLVRTFIRTNFPPVEREWFIKIILSVYEAFFGSHRSHLKTTPRLETLDHWTEGAELHIAAGQFADAMDCLHEISQPIQNSSSPNEFIRVARLLFDQKDWTLVERAKHFDSVFSLYVRLQALAGHVDECSNALERYRATIEGKEVRYINFCDLKCYTHWTNGDALAAVKWGAEGVSLKAQSDADTVFDASHNLALAQRDSGAIDSALAYFLKGASIRDVISAGEPDSNQNAPFYGNIGRCLQLMGQIESALICYRKSAKMLNDRSLGEIAVNQAYIRQWVGELLLANGETQQGCLMLEAAKSRWEFLSPRHVRAIQSQLSAVSRGQHAKTPTSEEAESAFLAWIVDS
ncbi:NB-ARC domain-containing protein [Kaistia soli DSM 19436]|uniref:NB-ARC domain-containing protein n=1 Tax=Kaistia soli DSM 19436 TaxID=1122133 RepID=A0A1M5DX77_9HYPH|nr:NB-ARC domain-containing protein [Kaistia soli DSM 19436]